MDETILLKWQMLLIRHSSYENSGFFVCLFVLQKFARWTKIHTESQGTKNSQVILKKKTTIRGHDFPISNLLQNHNNQDSEVLLKR